MLALAAAPLSFSPLAGATRLSHMRIKMQEQVAEPEPVFNPVEFAKELPGVASPLGFFDPLQFCAGEATEGRGAFTGTQTMLHSKHCTCVCSTLHMHARAQSGSCVRSR